MNNAVVYSGHIDASHRHKRTVYCIFIGLHSQNMIYDPKLVFVFLFENRIKSLNLSIIALRDRLRKSDNRH